MHNFFKAIKIESSSRRWRLGLNYIEQPANFFVPFYSPRASFWLLRLSSSTTTTPLPWTHKKAGHTNWFLKLYSSFACFFSLSASRVWLFLLFHFGPKNCDTIWALISVSKCKSFMNVNFQFSSTLTHKRKSNYVTILWVEDKRSYYYFTPTKKLPKVREMQ